MRGEREASPTMQRELNTVVPGTSEECTDSVKSTWRLTSLARPAGNVAHAKGAVIPVYVRPVPQVMCGCSCTVIFPRDA
jgi:hypothetical protein